MLLGVIIVLMDGFYVESGCMEVLFFNFIIFVVLYILGNVCNYEVLFILINFYVNILLWRI